MGYRTGALSRRGVGNVRACHHAGNLPAGYGDCLLAQYPVGKRIWRMLVDTGPDETVPALRARLAALLVDAMDSRHRGVFIRPAGTDVRLNLLTAA
jgi:hypothetical protein